MLFANIFVLGISVSLVLCFTTSATVGVNSLQPCNFPAIYSFGGAEADTGALSAAFYPIPPPYGRTYFKRPVGRASDGRLIIDFIAEHLKLPHLNAFLNSVEANFRHGANFASIGATLSGWEGKFWDEGISPFGFFAQVHFHFEQFKAKTMYLYKQGKDRSILPRPEDFSKALYIIDVGHMDLSLGFRRLSNDGLRAKLPNITADFVAYVQFLYDMGARTIWIHNVGPIGCFPNTTLSVKDPKPGFLDQNGCVKSQNKIVMELNKNIKDRMISLRAKLSDATLTYVDVYSAEYDLISNAKTQGFTDPMKICCGIKKNGVNVECGKKKNINGKEVYAGSCENPSGHLSWDGIHYTDAANRWIADRILNGSLSDPPIPITKACHRNIFN